MGKLVKRLIRNQILASNSFVKIRNNNLFSFKTTPDFFAYPFSGLSMVTIATGGTITQVGDYKVHTFDSSGNFEVITLGSDPTVEYLIVAGGGGGGVYAGGGGGAGGFRTATGLPITVQSYPVIIGSGGLKTTGNLWYLANNTNGNNSSFNSITSIGGGKGGVYNMVGGNGGSGGGSNGLENLGGNATSGQGNNGGNGTVSIQNQRLSGGGGGGAGQIGESGSNLTNIGAYGGNGLVSSINGISTYYSGGGAGGKTNDSGGGTGQKGLGGLGGGGNSQEQANAPLPSLAQDGAANTGGGGGATAGVYSGSENLNGGNGGSGIIMIKYFSPSIYTFATGGIITQVGDYKVHTFNSTDNFVVTNVGIDSTVEYLIVAGGGSAVDSSGVAGGGGAGGLLTNTGLNITVQTYSVVIGSGGSSGAGAFNGNNSTFNSLTAIGGGYGGWQSVRNGNNGGSGGGKMGYYVASGVAGQGTASQGNNGGITSNIFGQYGCGGGGGAGAVGGNGVGNSGGVGGIGIQSSISGTATYYAGGGAGGHTTVGTVLGGLGGGGATIWPGANLFNSNGTANTGGGAGGTSNQGAANGGSGIVIIKYLSPTTSVFLTAIGGTITTIGDYKIHTFLSSDNFIVTSIGNQPDNNLIECLVVSGGGGGSGPSAGVGNGGGGAGGYLRKTRVNVNLKSYSVVIGSGGNGGTGGTSGFDGVSSSFNSIAPYGGGRGGAWAVTNPVLNYGSGGGVSGSSVPSPALGTVGQGNDGGTNGGYYGGSGGGGAQIAGTNSSSSTGTNGGDGLSNPISGTFTFYAAGGGGGSYVGNGALGGLGGGGNGGSSVSNAISPTNGTTNRGSGGGGSGSYTVNPLGGNGGSGIVIIKYRFQNSGYLPESQAYFNQVTINGGFLTFDEKTYIDNFINALGTDFAEFDRLWIFGLSDSIAARTSLANPTSTIITAVNGIPFTPNQGFAVSIGSQYLNTNFNPATQGVKYTLNNASYGIYSRTNSQGVFSDMGSYNGTSLIIIQARRESSALFNLALNDDSFIGLATANSLGLLAGSRISGTRKLIKNGSVLASDTYAANGIPSLNVYIGGYNNSGTAVITSARQYSACFFGSGAINQSNFYTALQDLGTSIGWAV